MLYFCWVGFVIEGPETARDLISYAELRREGAAKFSPPPCGAGLGAGVARYGTSVPYGTPPLPNPPPQGRGIAYGFEDGIALGRNMDSEDDSRIGRGVGWGNSRGFSAGWPIPARPMRTTISWVFWA